MRDIKVASRYAKSLLKIALDENSLEAIYNDMQLIHSTCANNHDLVVLLKTPIVKTDKKRAILKEVFSDNISLISTSFINIILTKKRESLLADIATAFIDIYKEHQHITTAYITSAVPLSKEQRAKITEVLNLKEKNNIDLKEIVNPDIIGGMIVKIGDKQIDESIKRKLINLKMEFDENPYVKEF